MVSVSRRATRGYIRFISDIVGHNSTQKNLEEEAADKTFEEVKLEASSDGEELLSKMHVTKGMEREKVLFYSCFYRWFLATMRNGINGEYTDTLSVAACHDFMLVPGQNARVIIDCFQIILLRGS